MKSVTSFFKDMHNEWLWADGNQVVTCRDLRGLGDDSIS